MDKLALFGGPKAVASDILPFNSITDSETQAALRVLKQGTLSGFYGSPQPAFFGGPEIQAFENKWAAQFGVKHAIAMNSATSCLIAAMGAIGLSPQEEVIVSPYSMSASAVAPIFYGGIPIFADIEKEYYCLDPAAVKQKITPKTKAIIAVNLFGHPADLIQLRSIADEHQLYLIEDCAQTPLSYDSGQRVGTIGEIGIFSLNVHKHIQSGEGGVCITNNDNLALRLKLIRNHGENVTEWLNITAIENLVGFNFRMSELHAAISSAQLERIDELVERCEYIGNQLTEGLLGLSGLHPSKTRAGCRHNFFKWNCRIDTEVLGIERKRMVEALVAEGVPMTEGYVKPLYYLPVFQKQLAIGRHGFPFKSDSTYPAGLCLNTEICHFKELMQLQPVAWDIKKNQLEMIMHAFHKVYQQRHLLA